MKYTESILSFIFEDDDEMIITLIFLKKNEKKNIKKNRTKINSIFKKLLNSFNNSFFY